MPSAWGARRKRKKEIDKRDGIDYNRLHGWTARFEVEKRGPTKKAVDNRNGFEYNLSIGACNVSPVNVKNRMGL